MNEVQVVLTGCGAKTHDSDIAGDAVSQYRYPIRARQGRTQWSKMASTC